MKLPLLVSVPHAGTQIPEEIQSLNVLTPEQIIADGDVGAKEIYQMKEDVAAFVTTGIARAFVDVNRSPDDFSKDGVVKTHTCWDVPVYKEPPDRKLIESLLQRYYEPYHLQLSELARNGYFAGIDCHTMAETAPPVAPDPGQKRPLVCISYLEEVWEQPVIDKLFQCFKNQFDDVKLNDPFKGGFIIRRHSSELPWIQIELSRTDQLSSLIKRDKVLSALSDWCG